MIYSLAPPVGLKVTMAGVLNPPGPADNSSYDRLAQTCPGIVSAPPSTSEALPTDNAIKMMERIEVARIVTMTYSQHSTVSLTMENWHLKVIQQLCV